MALGVALCPEKLPSAEEEALLPLKTWKVSWLASVWKAVKDRARL